MKARGAGVNRAVIMIGDADDAVQAGTPMTATGNGTSLLAWKRGVSISCPQISQEVNWPQAKRRAAPSWVTAPLRRARA